jgi:glutamyl-tRNA synthetase
VFAQVAPLVQTRVVTLSEVPDMIDFVFLADPIIDEAAWSKTMSAEFAADVLRDFSTALSGCDWNHDALKNVLESWTESRGLKLGKTQAPIRVAITGRTVGPPLFESIEILGREETQHRLAAALSRLG